VATTGGTIAVGQNLLQLLIGEVLFVLTGFLGNNILNLHVVAVIKEEDALSWQAVTVQPPDRPALDFEAAEFADPRAPANAPAVCIAYVHQSAGRAPVAVDFRVAQANRAGIDTTVKKSLESYAEAGDAGKARTDFAKRTAH